MACLSLTIQPFMNNKNNRNIHRQSIVIVEQESVPGQRLVSSSELFGAQNEILIDHHNDEGS